MGTPDFAKESLEALIKANYNVEAVVTNPDKPKGRGMKLMMSPVKEFAIESGIKKIYQPEKIRKNEEFINEIKNMNPDLIVVVAYGKILPKEILDIPKYGCVNVHGSLLPKYRGAAPIQWAVLNGDKVTGVTTMFMDAGMDTGDMILKKEVTIGDNETTGELWDRLSKIGGELLVETVKKIKEGTAPREKQGDSFYDGKKIKFWKVETYTDEQILNLFPELKEFEDRFLDLPEGTILFSDSKTGLYIKAKEGNIKVIEIQGENAKRMKTEDFLRGTYLAAGVCFE